MRPRGTTMRWCEACGKHKVIYVKPYFVCQVCGANHENSNKNGNVVLVLVKDFCVAGSSRCSICSRLLIDGMISQNNPKHCYYCDPNHLSGVEGSDTPLFPSSSGKSFKCGMVINK